MSWNLGPRDLFIDEQRLWKQGFFFDVLSPNDWTCGAAASVPTFDHPHLD
jgi:hypothetical protein